MARPVMGAKDRRRFSQYLAAPSGLTPVGDLTPGKPWAMLFWPLRATDSNVSPRPSCRMLEAKQIHRRRRERGSRPSRPSGPTRLRNRRRGGQSTDALFYTRSMKFDLVLMDIHNGE